MRILRWILGVVLAVVVVVLLLDTFGGFLFDGPLGPIPAAVAVKEPLARVRTHGQIYERRIERSRTRRCAGTSRSCWRSVTASILRIPSRTPPGTSTWRRGRSGRGSG
jgi:hypothetical protein